MLPQCYSGNFDCCQCNTHESSMANNNFPIINEQGILATRHASIVAVTCLFLYPLCSLRSLAALSPVSIVGIVSVLLTCVFMAIRAVDGTYGPSGVYSQTMAKSLQPSFAKIGTKVMSPSILVLTSMAATAYLVHFLAPEFYNDLRDKNLKSFRLLSTIGFGVTSVVSVLFMCLGFLSFGGNASGMILNNFSTADFGASICRLLMAISLIGSYPFLFSAIRSNYVKMTTQGKAMQLHDLQQRYS